jgi:AraC family carnitine catabolism transcriptional activator
LIGVWLKKHRAVKRLMYSQRISSKSNSNFDIIFVIGSWECEHYLCDELFNWLRWQHLNGVIICGVEVGVYILARAKLLSRKLATTHWSVLAGFAEQFPGVQLKEQLYTVDKNILTCCGGTAGIDLMLYLIADKHGEQLCAEISDQIIHHPIRSDISLQRHTHGSRKRSIHPYIDSAIKLMEADIVEPLSIPAIAERIGISQRQLERYFKRYLGCSVVQFSQLLRLQYARVLLTSTQLSIREVSVACGFNSMSHFANVFSKNFGKKPSQYRHAWPESESAPSWPGTVFSLIKTSHLKSQIHGHGHDHRSTDD